MRQERRKLSLKGRHGQLHTIRLRESPKRASGAGQMKQRGATVVENNQPGMNPHSTTLRLLKLAMIIHLLVDKHDVRSGVASILKLSLVAASPCVRGDEFSGACDGDCDKGHRSFSPQEFTKIRISPGSIPSAYALMLYSSSMFEMLL